MRPSKVLLDSKQGTRAKIRAIKLIDPHISNKETASPQRIKAIQGCNIRWIQLAKCCAHLAIERHEHYFKNIVRSQHIGHFLSFRTFGKQAV